MRRKALLGVFLLAGVMTAHAATNILSGVSPASAPQGTNGLLVTFTLNTAPPPPPVNVVPTSATIGSLVGTSLKRVSTNTASAVFDIPPNEPVGLKNVRLFFPTNFHAISTNRFSITTTAATNGPWRFAVFSDTHASNAVAVLPEMAAAVVADGVKFVIASGDIAQGGLGATRAELQSQLLLWRTAMGPVYSNGIGVCVVRGNHEDDVPGGLAAWTNVFSGAYAMPGNGPAGESNLTYAFRYHNALFLGFDVYANIHRVNQPWLDQQLASNSLPHVFAFGHEAAFKVFHADCLGSYPAERNAFWSSLAAAGGRVYFCGHDHFFDLARIDDGDGNAGNDLYQCEVGTSGGWFMTNYNYNGTNAPYSPVNVYHETNHYGYVLAEVSGTGNTNLGVTLTWKRRTYDTDTASYVYLATTSVVRYTARSVAPTNPGYVGTYLIADTGQTNCYHNTALMAAPAPGQPFYGQDAQLFGNQPAYRDNGDGTVSDLNTGLMWVKARGTKKTWTAAFTNAALCSVGGHTDWRVPTIKEVYSLILFSGANGQGFTNTAGYLPFLDTNYFDFVYGSGTGTERVIDCQDWSATPYVSTTMNGDATVFGVNFADGRIKGYPKFVPGSGGATGSTMYFRFVRGNASYGMNNFTNHGDGTITDLATGLMWPQHDSGAGLNWSNALAWVQGCNATSYLGHQDWRLPNAKELQSILDYTRSPATTASAAIDPIFTCTAITNEGGALDFPFYWAGTTLLDGTPQMSGVYLCFGRALGYMNSQWLDVHGAGTQRSDFKAGNPADYPTGRGPQGDCVRIYNFVRPVRGGSPSGVDHIGDGIPDWWRRQHFGGSGMTTNASSCASCDGDLDGMSTMQEYVADTNPTSDASRLAIVGIALQTNGTQIAWMGGTGVMQIVESRRDLADTNDAWLGIATNRPPTAVTNSALQPGATGTGLFFRVQAWR